ncbi:hypothetical protein BJX96DRAFT_113972 [Aspergillus floccosus]
MRARFSRYSTAKRKAQIYSPPPPLSTGTSEKASNSTTVAKYSLSSSFSSPVYSIVGLTSSGTHR